MNESFFYRLKEERKRLGLTQASAATHVGVARETWSRYETGALAPGMEVLSALAMNGADANYLLTGKRSAPIAQPLQADEQMWLDCYRGWEMPVKRKELARALGLSPSAAEVPQSANVLPSAVQISGNQQNNSGHGVVQIGSMGQPPTKRRR